MATKINEFIASLVDASIPEEQQSFLLTSADSDVQGGDNIEGICINRNATGCAGTNHECTNFGNYCAAGKNTKLCDNREESGFDQNSDYSCIPPIKP